MYRYTVEQQSLVGIEGKVNAELIISKLLKKTHLDHNGRSLHIDHEVGVAWGCDEYGVDVLIAYTDDGRDWKALCATWLLKPDDPKYIGPGQYGSSS